MVQAEAHNWRGEFVEAARCGADAMRFLTPGSALWYTACGEAAQAAGFGVVGYYFRSRVEDCMRRNGGRPEAKRVPLKGLLGTAGRMELPSFDERFDELHYVWIAEGGGFVVEGWRDEDG